MPPKHELFTRGPRQKRGAGGRGRVSRARGRGSRPRPRGGAAPRATPGDRSRWGPSKCPAWPLLETTRWGKALAPSGPRAPEPPRRRAREAGPLGRDHGGAGPRRARGGRWAGPRRARGVRWAGRAAGAGPRCGGAAVALRAPAKTKRKTERRGQSTWSSLFGPLGGNCWERCFRR